MKINLISLKINLIKPNKMIKMRLVMRLVKGLHSFKKDPHKKQITGLSVALYENNLISLKINLIKPNKMIKMRLVMN